WPKYPPGAAYGRLYDHEPELGIRAARLGARLIAADLGALGISVDCLPVADMPVPGANSIIGDRAYGSSLEKVAAIAAAIAERFRRPADDGRYLDGGAERQRWGSRPCGDRRRLRRGAPLQRPA